MPMNELPPLRWFDMTPREQSVWTVAYAQQSAATMDAVRIADNVVRQMRGLNIESYPPVEIWEIAARSGCHIERNDFDIWYRVTSQIQDGRKSDFHMPTEEECAIAYEAFQRGRADFY